MRLINYQEVVVTYDYGFKIENITKTQSVLYGNKAPLPDQIQKTGYTFLWWEEATQKGQPFDFEISLTRHTTLKASYKMHSITAEFYLPSGEIPFDHNGQQIMPVLIEYDDVIFPPTAFLDGYDFAYWTAIPPTNQEWPTSPLAYDFSQPIRSMVNIVLYAFFFEQIPDNLQTESSQQEHKPQEALEYFSVTVDYDDGINIYLINNVQKGSVLSQYKPPAPSKGNKFYFTGWYIFDQEQNKYQNPFDWDNTPVNSDLIVRAKWVEVLSLDYSMLSFGPSFLSNMTLKECNEHTAQITFNDVIDWTDSLTKHDDKYWIKLNFLDPFGCYSYKINQDTIRAESIVEIALAQKNGDNITLLYGSSDL